MLYDKKNCVQNIYFWIWPAFVERIRKGKITMINIAICDSDESGAFRSAFWAAYKRIAQRPEYFSYTFHKICFKLPLDKIIYFSSCNRVIMIHAAENIQPEPAAYDEKETNFYGKMNDLEKQLAERGARFIRIHQSFLVNFDYIKSMGSKEVIMLDGTSLQISEDRYHVRNPMLHVIFP